MQNKNPRKFQRGYITVSTQYHFTEYFVHCNSMDELTEGCQKLLAIVGGVLAILGLGWLVKILSSIMIDNSKKIKFLDYMDGSL